MLALQTTSILSANSPEYQRALSDLIDKINKGDVLLDQKSIHFYWLLGKSIAKLQEQFDWGSNFVESMSQDLNSCFPDIKGFSTRNIFNMIAFYMAYCDMVNDDSQIDSLPMFLIPWTHNTLILEKVKDPAIRFWYAQKAYEGDWVRSTLAQNINSQLYQREGSALSNFDRTLTIHEAKIVNKVIKDPYIFTFADIDEDAQEKDVEKRLLRSIRNFLSELGEGFTLYGHQYHLSVGKESYYIDLLFYHIELRRFIVVELKSRNL